MEGQGYSPVAAHGIFQGFLGGSQQLLEEFRQLAQEVKVNCLKEDFIEKNPSKLVADKGGDG